MATDVQKQYNMSKLLAITLAGLTTGVWDTLGDSSFALCGPVGKAITKMLEKDMGLEIAGETPEHVVQEIKRIFVDEFGMVQEMEFKFEPDKYFEVRVRGCALHGLKNMFAEDGAEPFICPIMNTMTTVFARMGSRTRGQIKDWPEANGSIITITNA